MNKLCKCNSGLEYKDCCLPMDSFVNKMLKEGNFKKCLFGEFNCEETPRGCHSISESQMLGPLSENSELIIFKKKRSNNTMYDLIGKGIATTFYGLCNFHDSMFNPIDEIIDYNDFKDRIIECSFLFMYRSVYFSYYKALTYLKCDLENIKKGNLSLEGMQLHLENLRILEKDLLKLKKYLDNLYGTKNYSEIETVVIEFDENIKLSLSEAFRVEIDLNGNLLSEAITISSNILIIEDKTFVLLSYPKSENYKFKQILNQIKKKKSSDLIIHLQNWFFYYVSNFVVSPSLWEQINSNSQNLIIDKIYQTGRDSTNDEINPVFNFKENNGLLMNTDTKVNSITVI